MIHCPHCATILNDPAPKCPRCGFHIRDLDADLGEPPPRTGAVTDAAGALTPEERGRIEARCAALAGATGADLAVAIVRTTAPRKPAEHVFWLFNRWRVGGDAHAGALLLLALEERRIESEIGFALERFLTDAASTRILEEHAVPFLRAGRLGEGLYHAVDLVARVLETARPKAPAGAKP